MPNLKQFLLGFISLTTISFPSAFARNSWKAACAQTANLKIYSNALSDEETGDLNGYELAVKEHKDSTVDAFLYVYEGGASEGIHLPGVLWAISYE